MLFSIRPILNSGYGAGSTGAESSIALGTTKIVTAKGGGRDAGASAKGKYTDGKAGGAGGSGGGGRPNKAGGAADAGSVDAAYVLSSQKYANAGGAGCTVAYEGYGYGAAGGGGGATEAGGNGTKVDEYKGGDGGEGLACDITGALLVYGSGGGGSSTWGSAGVGGTGAGDGVFEGKGKDAVANQGGGGGGGSRNGDGGGGGSGIVVIRYTVPSWTPPMPDSDEGYVFSAEYSDDVLKALELNAATNVTVKVNGELKKGDDAVNALNTAIKFDGALTFVDAIASLDIVVEVTEVNVENPADSKYVVKRGDTVLNLKEGATVNTSIKEIDLDSDAEIFKLVIE